MSISHEFARLGLGGRPAVVGSGRAVPPRWARGRAALRIAAHAAAEAGDDDDEVAVEAPDQDFVPPDLEDSSDDEYDNYDVVPEDDEPEVEDTDSDDGSDFDDEYEDGELEYSWQRDPLELARDRREEREENAHRLIYDEIAAETRNAAGVPVLQRNLLFLLRAFARVPTEVDDRMLRAAGEHEAVARDVAKRLKSPRGTENNELRNKFYGIIEDYNGVARLPLLYSGRYRAFAWDIFLTWAAARVAPMLDPGEALEDAVRDEVRDLLEEYKLRLLQLVFIRAVVAANAAWDNGLQQSPQVYRLMTERDMRNISQFRVTTKVVGAKKGELAHDGTVACILFYVSGQRYRLRFRVKRPNYGKGTLPVLDHVVAAMRADSTPGVREFVRGPLFKVFEKQGAALIRHLRGHPLRVPCSRLQNWNLLLHFPRRMWLLPSAVATVCVFRSYDGADVTREAGWQLSKTVVAHAAGEDSTTLQQLEERMGRLAALMITNDMEALLQRRRFFSVHFKWSEDEEGVLNVRDVATKRGSVRRSPRAATLVARMRAVVMVGLRMALRNRTSSMAHFHITMRLDESRRPSRGKRAQKVVTAPKDAAKTTSKKETKKSTKRYDEPSERPSVAELGGGEMDAPEYDHGISEAAVEEMAEEMAEDKAAEVEEYAEAHEEEVEDYVYVDDDEDEDEDDDDDMRKLTTVEKDLYEDSTTKGKDASEVLIARSFNMTGPLEITRKDLLLMKDGQLLNDELMNFYLGLLQDRELTERSPTPRVAFFNTYFSRKLYADKGEYDYENVRRWTSFNKLGYNVYECDLICVPIHEGIHWTLATIDLANRRLTYYDSLRGQDKTCLMNLALWVMDEFADKGGPADAKPGIWPRLFPQNTPRQNNGCDCGVFALKFADYLSRGIAPAFSQRNIPYFRRKMNAQIRQGAV